MTEPNLRSLLVTEALPPPDVGAQEAVRRTAWHQELVSDLVAEYGGEVLLVVGRGCVASLPSPGRALDAVTALVTRRVPQYGDRARIRAALHLGQVTPHRTLIAEPGITEARRLLESAGPTEVVLSAAMRQALGQTNLQVAPLASPNGSRTDPPTGYRVLLNPLSQANEVRGPAVSGWLMAGAVLLAAIAIVGSVTAALLL
ncbi:MAG: hypothetical protein ABI333_27610 [bacterium]